MTAADPERDETAGPRVVVTVGTDHHPFNRLISSINDWLNAHPEQVTGFFVQSGTASVTPACPAARFLDVDQLAAALDEADVIVCHGGPESIAAAWARGRLPIVMPRLPQLGEHVDDHQVRFCRELAELGRIWLAQTPAEFASKLSEATRDPARLRASVPAADVEAAVARLGELVEELVGRPRRRLPLWFRSRRASRRQVTGPLAIAVNMPAKLTTQSGTNWNSQGGHAHAGLHHPADEEQ